MRFNRVLIAALALGSVILFHVIYVSVRSVNQGDRFTLCDGILLYNLTHLNDQVVVEGCNFDTKFVELITDN